MNRVDFDDFSESYTDLIKKQLSFFCSDESYFAEYKVRIAHEIVKGVPRRILEFGCGIGRNLEYLHRSFREAAIHGCDISLRCLERAQSEHPYAKLYLVGRDAMAESFDLIFIANVFHHIVPRQRAAVMNMVVSLLASQGELLIFEHNPYNPATRHMVNHCPFDADAELIPPRNLARLVRDNGLEILAKRYALFFPPRWQKMRLLEQYLGNLPLGGQYYIHAYKK